MKTLIFLLIANLGLAQSLTPQFGIHWTGGMTYDNDHEAPSAQVGLIYTPKTPDLIMSNIGINANYYYDFLNEIPSKNNTDFGLPALRRRGLKLLNFKYSTND